MSAETDYVNEEWAVINDIVCTTNCDGLSDVCQMRTFWDDWEQRAQLIASAPKLLEALKKARKNLLKSGVTVDNADLYNMIDSAIKEATK